MNKFDDISALRGWIRDRQSDLRVGTFTDYGKRHNAFKVKSKNLIELEIIRQQARVYGLQWTEYTQTDGGRYSPYRGATVLRFHYLKDRGPDRPLDPLAIGLHHDEEIVSQRVTKRATAETLYRVVTRSEGHNSGPMTWDVIVSNGSIESVDLVDGKCEVCASRQVLEDRLLA